MVRATALALLAAVALAGAYVALGAGEDPAARRDPCTGAAPAARGGVDRGLERVALVALDGAACDLRVSREQLVLAVGDVRDLPARIPDARREQAIRAGLRRALDEEQRAGRISPTQAAVLRSASELLPIDALLDQLLRR